MRFVYVGPAHFAAVYLAGLWPTDKDQLFCHSKTDMALMSTY